MESILRPWFSAELDLPWLVDLLKICRLDGTLAAAEFPWWRSASMRAGKPHLKVHGVIKATNNVERGVALDIIHPMLSNTSITNHGHLAIYLVNTCITRVKVRNP